MSNPQASNISQLNPRGELVCCIRCGRDTKSKSATCYACGGRGGNQIHDTRNRRTRDYGNATKEDDYGEDSFGEDH